ncbi:hypothetical protein VTN00DRAFT_6444 [Thermoascus crustaceus]|uniref:uncharacterized protein n=1 Tax=Thermoascus crustaceus TaxID=5088 RepID=UPI003743F40C
MMPSMDPANLPNSVLEAFILGCSTVSKFILDAFGFDVSLVVFVDVLIFDFVTALDYIYRKLWAQIHRHFTASVTVESHDDIFDHIVAWVSNHHVSNVARSLRVKSSRGSTWDAKIDLAPDDTAIDDLKGGSLFNFSNWEAKFPPRFEPGEMSKWFWHKGHFLRFKRNGQAVLGDGLFRRMLRDNERAILTVLGRSTQPIKDLIMEARTLYLSKEVTKTTVRRPAPKGLRQRGLHVWSKVATPPSRSVDTVVLDRVQTKKLLADINEYLHPETARWYANRGIPYRRGYLFYGPPGTGKTSLSLAIAGVLVSTSTASPSLSQV